MHAHTHFMTIVNTQILKIGVGSEYDVKKREDGLQRSEDDSMRSSDSEVQVRYMYVYSVSSHSF